jgi:hypothetical protein
MKGVGCGEVEMFEMEWEEVNLIVSKVVYCIGISQICVFQICSTEDAVGLELSICSSILTWVLFIAGLFSTAKGYSHLLELAIPLHNEHNDIF